MRRVGEHLGRVGELVGGELFNHARMLGPHRRVVRVLRSSAPAARPCLADLGTLLSREATRMGVGTLVERSVVELLDDLVEARCEHAHL